MNRAVFCSYLQRQAAGLDSPPYPGEIGQRIYDHISQEAWREWQKRQIMLINERKLNLSLPEDRRFLEQSMVQFLFEGAQPVVAGYTPE